MRTKEEVIEDYRKLCLELGNLRTHYLASESTLMERLHGLNAEMDAASQSRIVSIDDSPEIVAKITKGAK